jgi:hypothetical protein
MSFKTISVVQSIMVNPLSPNDDVCMESIVSPMASFQPHYLDMCITNFVQLGHCTIRLAKWNSLWKVYTFDHN